MQLLRKNPHLRLGARRKDMKTILSHGFFKDMDWAALLDRRVEPPIIPIIVSVTRKRIDAKTKRILTVCHYYYLDQSRGCRGKIGYIVYFLSRRINKTCLF